MQRETQHPNRGVEPGGPAVFRFARLRPPQPGTAIFVPTWGSADPHGLPVILYGSGKVIVMTVSPLGQTHACSFVLILVSACLAGYARSSPSTPALCASDVLDQMARETGTTVWSSSEWGPDSLDDGTTIASRKYFLGSLPGSKGLVKKFHDRLRAVILGAGGKVTKEATDESAPGELVNFSLTTQFGARESCIQLFSCVSLDVKGKQSLCLVLLQVDSP